MDQPYEEEQDSIESSLEEFEQELFNTKEEKFVFYRSQEKQTKKELSEDRATMQRLSESLPPSAPSANTPEYETYSRIEKELQILKSRIAEKNAELMEILKSLDSLSSD